MACAYKCLGWVAVFGALAQTPNSTDFVLRFDVDLVQVDAIVTDSHGNHISGLKPENFEVFQDFKRQRVTHFSYVAGGEFAASGSRSTSAPNISTAAPTRSEVRRTIVFVLDDWNMAFSDFHLAQEAIQRYIGEQLQPNDIAALLRTSFGWGALEQFTSDKNWLAGMLRRVSWHPPLASEGIIPPPLINDLAAVIRALAPYPGRKSIVLISPGLPPMDSWAPVRYIADAANRASVTIETIDSRGLPTLSLTAADASPPGLIKHPQVGTRIELMRSTDYYHSQDVLSFLAQMTAGRFQHDANDLAGQVRQAVDDAEGYYLIGWYPGAEAFQDKPNQPLDYHRVQIRLRNVKGLSVRTRDGFFARPGSNAKVSYSPAQQMNQALFSPFRSGDLDVRLTASLGYNEQEGAYIESLLHIMPTGIVFRDVPDRPDCKRFDLEVLSTPEPLDFDKTPKGKLNSSTADITVCRKTDGLLDELLKEGIVVAVLDPIAAPGGYRMLVAVRNREPDDAPSAGSTVAARPSMPPAHTPIGSANQLVDVPDTRKEDMVLTGITLESGEFQEPPANEKAFYRVASPNDPAVRQFHPGETLNYAFRLLRPERKSMEPSEVRVEIVQDGKTIYTAPTRMVKPGERLTGSYTLDASAEAGHYLLEVSAGPATQWIDFEVKP